MGNASQSVRPQALPFSGRGAGAVPATIDVIRREMARSADMLSALAASLTEELLGLMSLGADPAVNLLISRMSEILQAEDRIQQRMQDMCLALTLLQESLEGDGELRPDAVARLMAQHLMLGEMRAAFAGNTDGDRIAAAAAQPHADAGEVDLF